MNLICSECERNWSEVGQQWKRKFSDKWDYKCSSCGNKRKPIKYISPLEKCSNTFNSTYKKEDSLVESVNYHSKKAKDLFKSDPKKLIFAEAVGGRSNFKILTPENILVIADLHEPFALDGYLKFCKKQYDKYNCDHVIFIGDLIDNHFASFHNTDPDGFSAVDELDFAISKIQKWSKVFPIADVVLGNHDRLILRRAYNSGVSKKWIKDFNEVLGVNWNFGTSFEYNNCLFRHGINLKAAPKSGSEMMNVIQGHHHCEAYVIYKVGKGKKVFGMQVGSGVDAKSYAMSYAKDFPRQAIACGLVLDYGETPIVKMMEL